jgi:hypothetical protein
MLKLISAGEGTFTCGKSGYYTAISMMKV